MNPADSLSLVGLVLAIALPWLVGTVWVYRLLRRSEGATLFIAVGYGFFLGLFATTLLLRLWNGLFGELSFVGVASLLSLLLILGGIALARSPSVASEGTNVSRIALLKEPRWQQIIALCFLLLIAWRHITLLQELTLRPLYAWDAWMNWAPKAIVWFTQDSLVDFVSPQQWLLAPGSEAYTLGNKDAWSYPESVPLIILWSMLGAGSSDHSLLYLPWWLAPIALAFVLFGHLRAVGHGLLLCSVASYVLLSLPYLNVHTALVGYADLWLAAAFTCGACALFEGRRSENRMYVLLALGFAVLCATLKQPGIVLGLILGVCVVRALLSVPVKTQVMIAAGFVVLGLLMAAIGVEFELPYFGKVAVGFWELEIARFGRYTFAFHPVQQAFAQSFWVMINWHLLWYLLPLFLVYRLRQRFAQGGLSSHLPSDDVFALTLASAFLVLVFFFTAYYQQAENFVTLNRALIYIVPGIVFACFVRLRSSHIASA